jgi:nitronate monooxygenase
MRDLFELPIIQAPMAGGPDTPALAAAVSAAGGLGSLGCAYVAPAEIEALAAAVRARTARPFALNLFIRSEGPEDKAGAGAEARVTAVLGPMRAELGLAEAIALGPGLPRWEDQLEAVLGIAPPVLSFTFGVPSRDQVTALRARGIFVVGTATTVDEAGVLDELGVDAICAQGAEAGGHRGTFLGRFEDALVGTLALVPQIVARTRRPVIAAGGIMDGRGIRSALALGATAVQLGTAFLLCPEAGTSAPHRAALREARTTVITDAFSGRPARGIRNRMTGAFEAVAPAPFPLQQRMTHELRRAATAQARPDLMQLWAGQGAPLVRAMPAAELVATLAIEAGLRDP